jgi:hypothetical protein
VLPGGQVVAGFDGPFARVLAGGLKLDAGAFGERFHAEFGEELVGAEARSSHWASSTTQRSGCSSATPANRLSTANPTRNRSGASPARNPNATPSASC